MTAISEVLDLERKKGAGLIKKTSEIFDIPGEVAVGVPRVTVTGCSRAHIENHRGLLEYEEDKVLVNAGKMMIKISGEKLLIAAMSDLELVVTGTITGVEFLI